MLPMVERGSDSGSGCRKGSKKPFYVYFRILHAYTIIYLKCRVYCLGGADAPVLIYGCV